MLNVDKSKVSILEQLLNILPISVTPEVSQVSIPIIFLSLLLLPNNPLRFFAFVKSQPVTSIVSIAEPDQYLEKTSANVEGNFQFLAEIVFKEVAPENIPLPLLAFPILDKSQLSILTSVKLLHSPKIFCIDIIFEVFHVSSPIIVFKLPLLPNIPEISFALDKSQPVTSIVSIGELIPFQVLENT